MPLCKKCHAELPPGANFCHKCGAPVVSERKRKARGNGTGTVYKRGKTWTALKTIGFLTNENGEVKRITRSKGGFRTKKEALEYLPNLDGAERKKKSLSWAAMYDAWQPTHRAGKSTMDCYAAAENYFRPIWMLPFDQIDIDDLQDCLDECPKGKRTRENMKALAGLLYKYAIPRHMATLNLAQYLLVGRRRYRHKDSAAGLCAGGSPLRCGPRLGG